jgi:hypothetical protein
MTRTFVRLFCMSGFPSTDIVNCMRRFSHSGSLDEPVSPRLYLHRERSYFHIRHVKNANGNVA